MGTIIKRNMKCERCPSSDAAQLYDDGWVHCFSCGANYKPGGTPIEETFKEVNGKLSLEQIAKFPIINIPHRQIMKKVCEFYGVRGSFREDGELDRYFFPFKGGNGYKAKKVGEKKETYTVGDVKGIFGIELFRNGGRRIIITEGEEDTLAIAQAAFKKWGKFYPVVSMGGVDQTKFIIEERDTIRKYDEVVLWFDNDEQGQGAILKACKIIGYDKVKVVRSSFKDANDVIIEKGVNEGSDLINNLVLDSHPFVPSSVVKGEELWTKLIEYEEKPCLPYPEALSGLNDKLRGMRLGEITLFISGSGAGKSTIIRTILEHIQINSKEKCSLIALEESPAESVRKLSGMAIGKNPAAQEIPVEELREGFDKIFKDERVTILDHVGSIKDSSIVDTIEYLALTGTKYFFLDHLTIMISEGVDGLDGLAAQDKVINDLKRLTSKHDIWIGLVSHLRKTSAGLSFEEGAMPNMDDIRGSGSVKQVCNDIVAFSRNTLDTNEIKRNTISFRVLKCRSTGLTGDCGRAFFEWNSGRLKKSDTEFTSDNFELIQ